MPTLAEYIADYIFRLLAQSDDNSIDIRRSDLAAKFNCAPSQVTYVLSTRFGPHAGFLVESRRGGGGYIRVIKLPVENKSFGRLNRVIGEAISHQDAVQVIRRLNAEEMITNREARLMAAVVGETLSKVEALGRPALRAELLRTMLTALLRNE